MPCQAETPCAWCQSPIPHPVRPGRGPARRQLDAVVADLLCAGLAAADTATVKRRMDDRVRLLEHVSRKAEGRPNTPVGDLNEFGWTPDYLHVRRQLDGRAHLGPTWAIRHQVGVSWRTRSCRPCQVTMSGSGDATEVSLP